MICIWIHYLDNDGSLNLAFKCVQVISVVPALCLDPNMQISEVRHADWSIDTGQHELMFFIFKIAY